MRSKKIRRRKIIKTVETDSTHGRVGAALLGGLGGFLFGPVGAIVVGAIGYAAAKSAGDEMADEDLHEGSADELGRACIMDGDDEVRVLLEKKGTGALTPLGQILFGDRISKTVNYELED